jgi:hypothetical protein
MQPAPCQSVANRLFAQPKISQLADRDDAVLLSGEIPG